MKRVLKIAFLIIIAISFVWTIFFLYKKSQPKPIVFETKTPFITNVIKKTVATGSIVPRKEIEIKPKVSGIIEEMYVEPGKKIKKGDLIAKIKIIPDMINLNNAESRVNKAKISLDDVKKNYDRQKQLYDQKVIPESEFQNSQTQYKTAKEELQTSEDNLDLIKEGVVKRSGQATNTLITSTIEGMVLDVPVEVGNSVIESNTFNAGTTIALVADMGEMIFKGKVDESEVGKLKEGMNLLLYIGAIQNETFKAKLEYVAPKGTLENGAIQFEIKAAINLTPGFFIRAGYSANADIVLSRRDSVLALEESLLILSHDSAFVEIETKPNVYTKKLIKTGLSDGINIEILDGLKKTDKIKVQQPVDDTPKEVKK